MHIRFSTTDRATIISATANGGERRTVAAIPLALESAESPVREEAVALREASQSFVAGASEVVATYRAAARADRLRTLVRDTLARPSQNLIDGGKAEESAKRAAWERLIAVPPADASTAALRQEDRASFALLSAGEQAEWIERATVEQLGAVIEAGRSRFAGVPMEIWARAENRYASLNFIRIAGIAGDFSRQPTLEDPLATGVDMDAAESAAVERLARHHRRNEITEGVRQALYGITTVVALTCDMDMQSAFALLTTARVPS